MIGLTKLKSQTTQTSVILFEWLKTSVISFEWLKRISENDLNRLSALDTGSLRKKFVIYSDITRKFEISAQWTAPSCKHGQLNSSNSAAFRV